MTEPRNARLVTDDGQEFPARLSQLPGQQEWVAYADWDLIQQRLGPDIRLRLLADDWDPGQMITFGPQFCEHADALIGLPRQPRTWAMPAEPPADVMKLQDKIGREYERPAGRKYWIEGLAHSRTTSWAFSRLLMERGPLTEVVDE